LSRVEEKDVVGSGSHAHCGKVISLLPRPASEIRGRNFSTRRRSFGGQKG
jgi:hypothetical protein